jgi:hypothetical protein
LGISNLWFPNKILGIGIVLFLFELCSSEDIRGFTVSKLSILYFFIFEFSIFAKTTSGLSHRLSDLSVGVVTITDPANKQEAVV